MKLIIGLGNPGNKYHNTRHNVGFMFIDQYAKHKNCDSFKEGFQGLYTTFMENNEMIFLFKPCTYMNLSGNAVFEICHYYHINLKDILVIYDDKDIPFASLRLREKGNPGSHNGMKNITLMLNSINFARIRVGIGQPNHEMSMVDFVLSKFHRDELVELNESFKKIMVACDDFIFNCFPLAMNKFNVRKNS